MLGLAIAYMFEQSLGPESPWYAYLQTVETTSLAEGNPRFWGAEDQELLAGTELYYHTLKVEEDDVAEVHKDDVLPFLVRHGLFADQPAFRTLECYRDALLAVASRAFEVDVYHGLSLVPGACLFNHSAEEDVHFEVQNQVCPLCGSAGLCEHLVAKLEGQDDDHDGGNCHSHSHGDGEEHDDSHSHTHSHSHSSEPKEEVTELSEEGLSSSFEYSDDEDDGFEDVDDDEEDDDDEEEDDEDVELKDADAESGDEEGDADDNDDEEEEEEEPDTCDIVTVKTILPGREVFNTYGELSNHQLASRYGFAIWDNPYEAVGLSPEIQAYTAENDLAARETWWARFFYEGLYGIKPEQYEDLAEAFENRDEEEDEEEEEDEMQLPPSPEQVTWEDEAYLTADGSPSEGLVKAIKVLTMPAADFSALQAQFEAGDYDTVLNMNTKTLSEKAGVLVKALLALRFQRYADGNLSSTQCKQLIEKLKKSKKLPADEATTTERKIMALTIKGTEKLVLERAVAWVSKLEQKRKNKKKPTGKPNGKPQRR